MSKIIHLSSTSICRKMTPSHFFVTNIMMTDSTVESTIRVMDRPLSFLKIICLANMHLFHRGSFSLTQKIVCFHTVLFPIGSSTLACIACLDPRIVWFSSPPQYTPYWPFLKKVSNVKFRIMAESIPSFYETYKILCQKVCLKICLSTFLWKI